MDGIRKAVRPDIPQVAAIYDRILTEEEQGRAAVGWIRGVYPTERTAQDALEAGTLFVLERDGAIAAAAKLDQNQVPEYANAPWRYPDVSPEQVMVLHTLVVDPAFAGKGCGTRFVAFYERYALEHGCPHLRMDTNAKTPPPGGCTAGWATGRRVLSPVCSTAFRMCNWSAWKRSCKEASPEGTRPPGMRFYPFISWLLSRACLMSHSFWDRST